MKTFFTPFKQHFSPAPLETKEWVKWLNRTLRDLRKIATRLPLLKADINLEIKQLEKLLIDLNKYNFNKTENIAIKQSLMQQVQDYRKAWYLLELVEGKIRSDSRLAKGQWEALTDKRTQATIKHTQQYAPAKVQAPEEAKNHAYRPFAHR